MKRVHVWVSGRVQGVFFRQSAQREARHLHLAGWVRNLPDGRVEGVAEGDGAAVDAWVAWCRQGPPGARVESLRSEDEVPRGEQIFNVLS